MNSARFYECGHGFRPSITPSRTQLENLRSKEGGRRRPGLPEAWKAIQGNFLDAKMTADQVVRRHGPALDGRSRGSLTVNNALECMLEAPESKEVASQMTVNFFEPAVNARNTDDMLSELQDRDSVTNPDECKEMVLRMKNHFANSSGTCIGSDPSMGGTFLEGCSKFN